LRNKNFNDNQIRVAGNFTAKHLPWYKENKIYNVYENFLLNKNTNTSISTISRLINTYCDKKYIKIYKNNQLILIENDENDPNLKFWIDNFPNWENETFSVFDKYLNENKIFIDLGGWIGTTAIYSSRKSKTVYCIEADIESFKDLSKNCKINCNNYILINKAIYNEDDIEIKFGKNKYLKDSKINDSTSHIYYDNESTNEGTNEYYHINTITIQSLINNYNLKLDEISLIKVDIEGGEEFILNDLFLIKKQCNIPLYISFHYSWWINKDLDRFDFLTFEQKNNIISYPFTSILF
jgi:FkbM family methyltransferase